VRSRSSALELGLALGLALARADARAAFNPGVDSDQPEAAAAIAAALCARGLFVEDRYLDQTQVRELAACAQMRLARGEFAPARIGAARAVQRREEIRGDCTCWLAEPLFPAETALMGALEQLRLALNRHATLGLFDLELHYARYAPGAGYARHVDQPQGRDQRRVSVVLYLNSEWDFTHGGSLRIFDGAVAGRDIEPIGGRMVCFLTAGLEHEVLPSSRARLSVTGWFRVRV
jgi:SM-20-related protein